MSRMPFPLICLGPFPPGMLDGLGKSLRGFTPIEIPEPEFLGDLGPFLTKLEARSEALPEGPIVVLCPHGSEFRRQLDDAIGRLYRPRREIHLVLPLPFGFEGNPSTVNPSSMYWSEFLCRSITLFDGRSMVARLPRKTTIMELFRIQGAKLAHLLTDLQCVLNAPRHTYVRRSLTGTLEWSGTWESHAAPMEHLATLIRSEETLLDLVVSHGVTDPKRLLRMPRRLRMEPFLLCRGKKVGDCRLGVFGRV